MWTANWLTRATGVRSLQFNKGPASSYQCRLISVYRSLLTKLFIYPTTSYRPCCAMRKLGRPSWVVILY